MDRRGRFTGSVLQCHLLPLAMGLSCAGPNPVWFVQNRSSFGAPLTCRWVVASLPVGGCLPPGASATEGSLTENRCLCRPARLVVAQVAVEPAHPSDLPALMRGLQLLNRADPFVEVRGQLQGVGGGAVGPSGQAVKPAAEP